MARFYVRLMDSSPGEGPAGTYEYPRAAGQAAAAYAAHQRSVAGPGPASTTGIARALSLALDMLEGKSGRKVIDISGDGSDNVDWVAAVATPRSYVEARAGYVQQYLRQLLKRRFDIPLLERGFGQLERALRAIHHFARSSLLPRPGHSRNRRTARSASWTCAVR